MKTQTPVVPASVTEWNEVGEPGPFAKVWSLATAGPWLPPRLRLFPIALFAWLPAACLMLYVKWTCLTAPGLSEVDVPGLLAGRSLDSENPYWVSLLERLGCLQADLILGFGVVPVVGLALLLLLGARWGIRWILGGCLVAIFILCIELQVLNTSSRFLAFEMAREAFEWAVAHRFQFLHYLDPGSLALLGGLGSAVTWAFVRRNRASPRLLLRLQGLTWGVYAVMLGLAFLPVGSTAPVPTHLHRSVVELSWKQWVDRPLIPVRAAATTRTTKHIPDNGLRGEAPPPWSEPWSAAVGIAEGYDVIVWSLETAPARSFDLGALPALSRLSGDSWIGERHFTTFPNTTHAHYSILTGCYPPRDVLSADRPPVISLPGILRSHGYAAGIYGGENFDAANSRTYRALGLDIHGAGLGDRQSLDLLLHDIDGHLVQNKRYFAMFCPQIGHGPWVDSVNPTSTPVERRRAILRTEDAWISSLVDLLKSRQRLDKTLLIVTGDHGVRDPAEDPAFRPGFVDEYSFHVPLIVYAPGVARGTRLEKVTSHIDLAPTVLGLLGVTSPGVAADGLPLWDESIRTRKTYFLGRSYLGADGYYDGRTSTFLMWNELRDLVMRSASMHFQPSTDLVRDDSEDQARLVFRHLHESTLR